MFNQKLILKIAFILAIIGGSFLFHSSAQAADLEVTWDSTPLFTVTNLAPGDTSVTKGFDVKNNSTEYKSVGFYITSTDGDTELLDVLLITIKLDGSPICSNKKLSSIADENNNLSLTTGLAPGQTKIFEAFINFDKDAGNNYQNKSVTISLNVGFLGSPPPPKVSPTQSTGGGPGMPSDYHKVDLNFAYPFQKILDALETETVLITNTGNGTLSTATLEIIFPLDYFILDSSSPSWVNYDTSQGVATWDIPSLAPTENYLITLNIRPAKLGANIITGVHYFGNTDITVYGEENIGEILGETTAPPNGEETPSSGEEGSLGGEAGFVPSFGGILGSTISRLKEAFVPQVFSEETGEPEEKAEEDKKGKVLGVENVEGEAQEPAQTICPCCFPCWLFWLMLIALIILLLLLGIRRYNRRSKEKRKNKV